MAQFFVCCGRGERKVKAFNILYILLPAVIITLSCSTPKTNNDNHLNNSAAILLYKDSIDASLDNLRKEKSLPYSVGDYTFLIKKYYKNDKAIVLVEQGDSGEYGSLEKRYYLKNGNLVLYTENLIEKLKSVPYSELRAFYNNGRQLFTQIRTATDRESLASAQFQKSKPLVVNAEKAFRHYEDALNQSGRFDLLFEGIIEYPKARYIVLGHPGLNPYRSSLLIQKQDNFIRELIDNPAVYRGRKLKMDWKKKDDENVYVSGAFK